MSARIFRSSVVVVEAKGLPWDELLKTCMTDGDTLFRVTGDRAELTQTGLERVKEYIGGATPKMGGQLQLERYMLRTALRNVDAVQASVTSQGKWIKRYRKSLKECFPFLDNDELRTPWYRDWEARLGSLVGEYTTATTMYLRIVDKITWYQGDFGDEGSCYWGDRTGARLVIDDSPNDGGIQVWEETPDYFKGVGRCWWQYDGKLDVLAMWNRYGSYRLPAIANAMSILTDFKHCIGEMPIRGVRGNGEYMMYVNGDCALLTNDTYKDGQYQLHFPRNIILDHLNDREAVCERCEEPINENEIYECRGATLCEYCYNEHTTTCAFCGAPVWSDPSENDFMLNKGDADYVCFCGSRCMNKWLEQEEVFVCSSCGGLVSNDTGCEECAPPPTPSE